jgi:hypothetical protein
MSIFNRIRFARHAGALALALTAVTAPIAQLPAFAETPAAPVEAEPAAGPVYVPYNESRPVLAYYYAWWEPEKLLSGIHQPVAMPGGGARQIVDDPGLLREHIRQAQSAGIDGFVVNQTSDMAALLDIAAEYDFRVTVQIDSAQAANQLGEFYRYVDHPAMVRYQGRPVIFFWASWTRDTSYWTTLRNRLDPGHGTVWLADGDKFDVLRSDVWDGISPYQIAWSNSPQTQLPGWGAKAVAANPGKLYVPPVAPGCDDSRVRPTTCRQDRRGGAYYQQALQGALASNPQWAVIISTFNEWMEDTQIEPSPAYGDTYLQLTRQFAETFKGSLSAPGCC